jgi:rRNA-processing protein FCF1
MTGTGLWFDHANVPGLLVDTNLLVLFVVGSVGRDRIPQFKRTRKYSIADYELLIRILEQFKRLYTVAHVMAEVSNLTDLSGSERLQARHILKEALSVLEEKNVPSIRASEHETYQDLGLVDAAIASVARDHACAVLTDDVDLYLSLSRVAVPVVNFAHMQAIARGL